MVSSGPPVERSLAIPQLHYGPRAGQFRHGAVGRDAADRCNKGPTCKLPPQLEIVESRAQFEQAGTLAARECQCRFEVISHGIGGGMGVGAKP